MCHIGYHSNCVNVGGESVVGEVCLHLSQIWKDGPL